MLPRHAEQRVVFDVEGLRRLAAQSVGRSPDDIGDLSRLAEGGFKCAFLITLRDDFQLVARIPYPATVPKHSAVGSEVATMHLRATRTSYWTIQPFPARHPPARSNVRKSQALT